MYIAARDYLFKFNNFLSYSLQEFSLCNFLHLYHSSRINITVTPFRRHSRVAEKFREALRNEVTVAERERSSLITYSRKDISRLLRGAHTLSRDHDRKSVYEVLRRMRTAERQCSGYELIAGFSCRLVDQED